MTELGRRGWADGAEVWPQVTSRPLQFSMSMADPFTFNVNPKMAALMSEGIAERRTRLCQPGLARRCDSGVGDRTGLR